MRSLYTGVGNLVSTDTPHCLKLCSDFFSRISIGKTIQNNSNHTDVLEVLNYQKKINEIQYYKMESHPKNVTIDPVRLKNCDLYFENPDGTVADVNEFTVHLDLFNNVRQI